MDTPTYGPLQLREIFHLEFLRRLSHNMRPDRYALKGGANLRFYFRSPRYSEDMDLDAHGVEETRLRDVVMGVLTTAPLRDTLASYGISGIVPPNLKSAKQTETTQRFKVHLATSGGEDLFTKIEFSRRGPCGGAVVEPVSAEVVRRYRAAPLLCPHYGAAAAFVQKLGALAGRSVVQARDIFDLHLLDPQADLTGNDTAALGPEVLEKARHNLFLVDFRQFADTVVAYLDEREAAPLNNPARWDDIRLTVARRIEALL